MLAIEGKEIDSTEFNSILFDNNHIVFIIGGSLGVCKSIKDRANLLISFSRMTFTHQFMRVLLLDQISNSKGNII